MTARTAAAAVPGPRRSPESKPKPAPADVPCRRLVPGAVNVVEADMFRNELSGMRGFGCIDAELGTLAVVDSRLSDTVRQGTAAALLKLLDGRSAPAFAWLPASGEPTVEDGEL